MAWQQVQNGGECCPSLGRDAQNQTHEDTIMDDADNFAAHDENSETEASIQGPNLDNDEDELEDDEDTEANEHDYLNHFDDGQMDDTILDDFLKYSAYAHKNFCDFTKEERCAIQLLGILRKQKCSLNTYDAIFEWHLRSIGALKHYETLADSKDYLSRKRLLPKLMKRYNIHEKLVPLQNSVTLPSSKARVNLITLNTRSVFQSLLTDPRIKPDDYMFFAGNPFAPPPENLNYIADLNTGRSYLETYKKLITKPGKQVLLPTPIYIDGAVTGQFENLQVTAVKITFGIFTRKARDRAHMWRTLGYIPNISKENSRGKKIFVETGHLDSMLLHHEMLEGEGESDDEEIEEEDLAVSTCKAQDLHTMLGVILKEYVQLQQTGFIWDLHDGKQLHKGVEFVPFVPFIKCDSDEGDKLCGSYTNRNKNVAQLCRYCTCPTNDSDNPRANYKLKTQEMVEKLIEAEDLEGLKAMAQQYINNAWYNVRFGLHNRCGVHGACPLEMLHALLLGIFKYCRDCFFEQIGPTSALAGEINALAKQYGVLFTRQSDRDLPKTKFSKGIQKGKLMAKEFTGVLLVMAAILRSTHGRKLLGQKKRNFGQDWLIDDWLMLVETLLQWETWLKSDVMEVNHVKRAKLKHRYIMYLLKKVGKRAKGMGLKLMKFHGIVHLADDILNCGVPMEVDTGSNESGHKVEKGAAKLTQKNEETFDGQISKRLMEFLAVELGLEELDGRPLWEYFEGFVHPEPITVEDSITTGGATLFVSVNEDTGENQIAYARGKEGISIETSIVDFLVGLEDVVDQYVKKLEIRTEHKRNGHIFRANPHYKGRRWRDWVLVDWGDDGITPCHIWFFVDLTNLPAKLGLEYGGIVLDPGVYAIVEWATYDEEDPVDICDTFVPITKMMKEENGLEPSFFLANVEAFTDPVAVIPDIGGAPNQYFQVQSRSEWRNKFINWLDSPHNLDEMDDLSDDEGQIGPN
jgi:hypothetical protein